MAKAINAQRSIIMWAIFGVILLFNLLDNCLADDVLRCYKCSVIVEKYIINNKTVVTPLCSKFDESDNYIVDCPYSTMCLKTISTLHLQNNQKQETITRGCAQQKNSTQVFKNRKWEPKHLVQEVYEEGCSQVTGNILAASTTTHCYCRGHLCNSSNLLSTNYQALAVIFLFTMWHWIKQTSTFKNIINQIS